MITNTETGGVIRVTKEKGQGGGAYGAGFAEKLLRVPEERSRRSGAERVIWRESRPLREGPVRGIHERMYGWLAVLCLGGIVYGSLLPFGFAVPEEWGSGLGWWEIAMRAVRAPQWYASTVDDVVTNLLLYVPAGGLMMLALRRRMGWAASGVVTVASLAGLCWCVESAQVLDSGRYSSILDWILNSAGAAIGAAVALPSEAMARGVVRLIRRRIWAAMRGVGGWARVLLKRAIALIAAAVLMLQMKSLVGDIGIAGQMWTEPSLSRMNLLPFSYQFRESYLVAGWGILGDMAWYGAMGAMLWMLLRVGRRQSVVAVACIIGGMTVLCELLKTADMTRYPDVTDVLVACVAGCVAAVVLDRIMPRSFSRAKTSVAGSKLHS